jgi:hypothetical protein
MSIKHDIDLVANGAPALAGKLFYRVESDAFGFYKVSIRKARWLKLFCSKLIKHTETLIHPDDVAQGFPAIVDAMHHAHDVMTAVEEAKSAYADTLAVLGDHAAPVGNVGPAEAAPELPKLSEIFANPALVGTESAPPVIPAGVAQVADMPIAPPVTPH